MNWYTKLLDKLELSSTSLVVENFKAALKCGAFRTFQEANGIDVSVSSEVSNWFNSKFKNWFYQLIGMLQSASNYADPAYVDLINSVIQSLEVARAYYSKQADTAFNSSLKNVALGKVKLLEEIISSLIFSYEQVLKSMDIEPSKTVQMTDAVNFNGVTPENFKWNKKKVIVNHVMYQDMQEKTVEQEQSQDCAKNKKDYLPWVFCGFFGLLAWSSAVTKPKSK